MDSEALASEAVAAAAAAVGVLPIYHHAPSHGFEFSGDVYQDAALMSDVPAFFPHLSKHDKDKVLYSAVRHIAKSDSALQTVPATGWQTLDAILAIHPFHATDILYVRPDTDEPDPDLVHCGFSFSFVRPSVTSEEKVAAHKMLSVKIASLLVTSSVLVVPVNISNAGVSKAHACLILYDKETSMLTALDPNGNVIAYYMGPLMFIVNTVKDAIQDVTSAGVSVYMPDIPVQASPLISEFMRGTCVMWTCWFIHALGLAGGRPNYETLSYIRKMSHAFSTSKIFIHNYLRHLSILSMMVDKEECFLYLATNDKSKSHWGVPCGFLTRNKVPFLAITPIVYAEMTTEKRRRPSATFSAVRPDGKYYYFELAFNYDQEVEWKVVMKRGYVVGPDYTFYRARKGQPDEVVAHIQL